MATLSDLVFPHSRGNGASVQRRFGSCQLYPRPGQGERPASVVSLARRSLHQGAGSLAKLFSPSREVHRRHEPTASVMSLT